MTLAKSQLVWTLCTVLLFLSACARSEAPSTPPEAPAVEEATLAAQKSAADAPPSARRVVREASLRVQTTDVSARAAEAEAWVTERGGHLSNKVVEHASDTVVQADLELRVPVERFSSALGAFRRTGKVLSESVTGKDVTEELTDVDARLRSKRQVEERLLAMTETAKSVKDMLEVEAELGRVRSEIEQLAARTALLETHAALSTVRLTLISPTQPLAGDDESVRSRVENAVSRAVDLGVSSVTTAIVLSGVMVPLSLPLLLVVGIVRRRRRRVSASLAVS